MAFKEINETIIYMSLTMAWLEERCLNETSKFSRKITHGNGKLLKLRGKGVHQLQRDNSRILHLVFFGVVKELANVITS